MSSPILSTHSGHHRIFIGPVVQGRINNNNNTDVTATSTPSSHSHYKHHNHTQPKPVQAPKPWWEQGSSFLRSHISLHNVSTSATTATPPLTNSSRTTPATTPSPQQHPASSTSQHQTNIPQLSYTFSDDDEGSSCSSSEVSDEEINAYDSEDERRDYTQDHDVNGDDEDEDNSQDDDNGISNKPVGANNHPFHTSSSSESFSAPVAAGHSSSSRRNQYQERHGQQSSEESGQLLNVDSNGNPIKNKDKGKAKDADVLAQQAQDDACMSKPKSVKRWRTGGKKRTKSMRDEGEPNRLKKILRSRRARRQNDEPDLGWESDGSRASRPRLGRQMTSGAMLANHRHDRQEHHSVLVSSPMSSEVNLPATNGPIYVSSPVSSALDVSNPDNLERPDPTPIQNLGSAAGIETDLLAPGWKSHSNSSLSSSGTPRNSNIQRGATWATAREYGSSYGQGSLHDKVIEEENESDEYDEENDHYFLAKTTSRTTDWEGAEEEGVPNQGTSNAAPNVTNPTAKDETAADTTSKEPMSATISKAGTLLSRTLLRRAPTGLKMREGEADKSKVAQPVESVCSIDKDCQTTAAEPSKKKHVRFLTKVQNPISSSRQPTMLSTNPMVKQDRMLVRKEVTERPGPHVFNSVTARRFELQSEGWKEWWCVMKGPPVGPNPSVNKIRRKSKRAKRIEKGRLEFFYNHNYPEAVGLTVYILRPRTISLACAWYMEIYTLLNGKAPIPPFIEISVPDFDVKIRVPIPEDSETETESDTDSDSQNQENDDEDNNDIGVNGRANTVNNTNLSSTLPPQDTPLQSFRTARTSLPERLASKTFYLKNDDARPTLVAPDEVTPRLLRSHVLALLKDVPDWSEVVKMWRDPSQFGDVALCWKRYDRIEWIYWSERIPGETDNLHLKKEHIGFADGSDWVGRMDETVVGPQVLDKTHLLELRPITHYPTKAKDSSGKELHEPDPIEGYLVRVSTFSGNPIRRFRRLYLTTHDHMLIYTIPSQSHSPTMQHAGAIDPTALMFSISPHHSANPDHKDMAQSRSVRRLKAQVRSARGYIDMTRIADIRVLTNQEWETVRHLPYDKKDKENLTKRERLGKAMQKVAVAAREAKARAEEARAADGTEVQEQPQIVMQEPDHYFFNTAGIPDASEGSSTGAQHNSRSSGQQQQPVTDLDSSEPLNASLSKRTEGLGIGHNKGSSSSPTFKNSIVRSTTFMADLLLHNDAGVVDQADEDSNVIEIEMMEGPCVRFRAFNSDAAHLWRDQLEKLSEYWRLRKHLDVREHMAVAQANYQLASSLDDDEIQVGETIQDWDNDRAVVSPSIWNWCVVNGCRSVTRSGYLYYKPKLHSTFRKIFMVLTEGMVMMFHPHRRSKASGQLVPTTACKLLSVHTLTDIYIYSGHFSGEDTRHGTNDESERLPRFYPDGLIVDDPDEDCTFSIWRGKRRKMFSRRSAALTTMSSKAMTGSSRVFGKEGLLSSIVKQGVVYGSSPQSCAVLRARSRPDLEQWVSAINTEIERVVRAERRRVRGKGHHHQH
ncbi:hypothetical protein KI688_012794 [Linnemannia hyalina]|uniref:PH domain-containing protein n=1 Tax=Linnemannia hyalina TaxID=64524 RepID=A0A9P8BVG3_9FUNG|nr:hypothetical protein KI688_012794 [Linnemannia hyalina]